ncbi:hypothetical protein ACFRNT_14300 [Streptomyces sp. NPDC056697]|uniref:hypothetical protein n=1 Tax=Streptomyces sp. NPDC056697 TaxID=3345915 RepID=UPI003678B792
MTDNTTTPYGDPTEWDEIPDGWTEAFTTAIEAHGHTVTEAHESAITIDVPGLDEGHQWYIGAPNFHGMWSYGVADETGRCQNPMWINADATSPQEIADHVHAVLAGAPMERGWIAGSFAVWLPATEPTT